MTRVEKYIECIGCTAPVPIGQVMCRVCKSKYDSIMEEILVRPMHSFFHPFTIAMHSPILLDEYRFRIDFNVHYWRKWMKRCIEESDARIEKLPMRTETKDGVRKTYRGDRLIHEELVVPVAKYLRMKKNGT